MKIDKDKDGGRQVRTARKGTQRERAKTGGALARRRTSREQGRDLKVKEKSPVRARRRLLAAAVRTDIMLNGEFSPRPSVRL